MKCFIVIFLLSVCAWSRPVIVLSAFDRFADSPFNNSQKLAEDLINSLKNDESFPVDLHFCLLPTKYDEGYATLSQCVAEVRGKELIGVISLGEAFCEVKIETIARNFDSNISSQSKPDNAGIKREGVIVSGAPSMLSFSLPLGDLYCDLNSTEEESSVVSVNAGSFVCNNTAYLFRYNEPDLPYSFLHVPANNCKNLNEKNKLAKGIVKKLILNSLASYQNQIVYSFPLNKSEAKMKMRENTGCFRDFYRKIKKAF